MRALAAVVLLLPLVGAAPAAAAPVPCGPRAAVTVTSGALTRAYLGEQGRTRVCTRGSRRSFSISSEACGPAGCPGDHRIVRVAGRLVASAFHRADGSFAAVDIVDAGTGRSAAPYFVSPSTTDERRWIGKAVLGGDGALAFTVRHEDGGRPEGVEVRRSEGCGSPTLDDGPGVDPGSVRLRRGGWIEWRHDGVARRAPACPTVVLARRVCPAAAQEDVLAVDRSVVALDRSDDLPEPQACAGARRWGGQRLGEFDDLLAVAVGRGWMALWVESCGHDDCIEFLDAVGPRGRRAVHELPDDPVDEGSLRIAGDAIRWTAGGAPASVRLPGPG